MYIMPHLPLSLEFSLLTDPEKVGGSRWIARGGVFSPDSCWWSTGNVSIWKLLIKSLITTSRIYLRGMLSFIVWQIESAITAVVPQMWRVRVFDVVGNVVQAKEHDVIKTVIDSPNFSFNLLFIWRACYWGVVLSARRSGLDWMIPAPSIPAITSIPAVAHCTLRPSHFLLLSFSLKVAPANHLEHHDTYPSFRTSSNLPI